MRLSLKFKVGLYAALVSAIALTIFPLIMRPYIYHRQLADLDAELRRDAEEIFKDLAARTTRGVDARRPVTREFLQQSVRTRYIRIWIKDGVDLYQSANWRNFDPRSLKVGEAVVQIQDRELTERNCRIITVSNGEFLISIGTRLGTLEAMQQDLVFAFKIAIPVVAFLVLAGTVIVAWRALRPIASMTAAAERISAERPSERLPVPDTTDEIERLSRVLNASFDRLEKAYSSSERFSSAASHQLKTPLTILRAGLSELRSCEYLVGTERETVEALVQQTRRLTTLCEDLLLLAQVDAGRLDLSPEALDLIPLVSAAIDDMEVLGMESNLSVKHELPVSLIAKADPRRVSIILQNLGDNAVKYNRRNGSIRVTARAEKGQAIVAVASTGPCIIPQDMERIFERFNRGNTGENLKGHGLGLSIARELARAHGGELRLARSDEHWTEFELILPLATS